MVLLPRDEDEGLLQALRGLQSLGAPHPRWDHILGSEVIRRQCTKEVHDGQVLDPIQMHRDDAFLTPACPWCGLPTGNFCDGFVAIGFNNDDRGINVVYNCGGPICTACERILGACLSCAYYCGVPSQHVVDDFEEAMRGWDLPQADSS